jgi:hypothetical protein
MNVTSFWSYRYLKEFPINECNFYGNLFKTDVYLYSEVG